MAFPLPRPQPPQLPHHLLRTVDCKQGAIRAVRFNADGNYILSCGGDKTLRLWSASRGTLLKTYSGHGYEVLDADGAFDNSHICSCSSDKTVILWDVASGLVSRKLRGHAGKVNCVRFNEEATVIVSGSIDGSVRCWDTRSRRPEPIQVLDEARDGVSSVKVSEYELLSGSVDGRVRRYDLRMGQLYTGHKNTSYKLDCCLSHKDTHVLSCSEDGYVYFWDLVEGSVSLKLPVGKATVQSLSFHPSEPRLLTAMEGSVKVWGAEPEDTVEDQGQQ
uniref:WD repeat domain-containing protein 83 n=1 Tax=Paramormyrops kingsleyae TaxID=1676925 RepID=A0A3B3RR72_9TELE